MASPSAARKQPFSKALSPIWPAAILLGMTLHLLYLGSFAEGAFQKKLITLWWTGRAGSFGDAFRNTDSLARIWTQKGNAVLKFSVYDLTDPSDTATMGKIYIRACYSVYPARIFTTYEETPRQLGDATVFEPDRAWLSRHGVTSEVLIRKKPDGPEIVIKPVR